MASTVKEAAYMPLFRRRRSSGPALFFSNLFIVCPLSVPAALLDALRRKEEEEHRHRQIINQRRDGKAVVDELREKGIKAGLLKIRVYRPFPGEEVAKALANCKAIAVLDKADSLNAIGGALFEDVTSSMYVANKHIPLVNYVYGIGGRDTTTKEIYSVYKDLTEIVKSGKVENPYRYLGLRKEEN